MDRFKAFLGTTFLGGVLVILPVAILFGVFGWLFGMVTRLIQPLTSLLVMRSDMKELVAEAMVLGVIVATCFLVGVFIRTRVGRFLHAFLEQKILKVAPGYTLIKETVFQILGNKKSPFSSVAVARIFGNETLVTCFVTDEHPDGRRTVFVPTGPNPTSGNIFHLKGEWVYPVDVSVEEAMRSIISCGAGSRKILEAYRQHIKKGDHGG